jgi:hypothetical protein
MKSVSLLSRFAACAVLFAIAGVAFDALALAFFATAVCALVLMIAAADYLAAPGLFLWRSRASLADATRNHAARRLSWKRPSGLEPSTR